MPATPNRITAIDSVRGLVMVLMALDHVRDLLHTTALTESPTDLNTTTPVLFFTRWITHLCAPTFVFLAGASAYLSYERSSDKSAAGSLMWKRGLWLIIMEFTLVNFALWFDVQFRLLMLQVIAAIGAGFIILRLLLHVNKKIIAGIAIAIIVLHGLVLTLPPIGIPAADAALTVLLRPGILPVTDSFSFFVAYPLLPWVAIMMLGFSMGRIFETGEKRMRGIVLAIGVGCLLLFALLRYVNVFGDPSPRLLSNDTAYLVLSFLNVSKYPPSLLFDLLFLGIMFVLVGLAHRLPLFIQRILTVYGRVPFFYYLLHLYMIRIAVFVMVFAQGFSWSDLLFGPFQFGRPASGSGVSLLMVYLVWIAIVALLYPLCKWYGNYKLKRTGTWWLKYL